MREGLAPPDQPFALVEKQRGALRIAAVNRNAAQRGLGPGLPLADARGRVPELATAPHDPMADKALIDRLVRLCINYTPSAAPDMPHGLVMDITGCAHLWGGEDKLRRVLSARIGALGFTARDAIAATPDAARALARFGGGDVRILPMEALEVEEATHVALRRAGFRRLGEIIDLPRAPLAARFGEELVALLDRMTARQDPHITPYLLPDLVTLTRRFAEPVGRVEDVLEAIGALTAVAAVRLGERGEGGRAFAVRLFRSDGHVAYLAVETGAPTRDVPLVLRLLRERIDSLADPLDPGFGYDAIELTVPVAEALEERQQELEPRARRNQDIGPLLDRLAVRHGGESVLRLAAGDSHVPERAGILKPIAAGDTIAARNNEVPWLPPEPGDPPLRPLLLFDPPQQVEVIAAVPDGPPRRFRWRGGAHNIVRQEGPERIAPEWWRRREGHAGNPGLSRDYYRVEDEAGHRFWLFRHGLYERETGESRWYVHGLFA